MIKREIFYFLREELKIEKGLLDMKAITIIHI